MTPAESKQPLTRSRLLGMGVELTASILGFAAVGYWLGGYFESREIGLLVGALLGIVGGMYNLIRVGLKASKRANAGQNSSED